MNKQTRLVPANDNLVPSSFQTMELEDDALDRAIDAAMDGEIITGCQCAVINSVPGCGRDD